jgi:tetratricopeptide (TPR) repeat protein
MIGRLGTLALILALGAAVGCASHPLEEAQAAYDSGDYDTAITKSGEAIKSDGSYGAYLLRGKSFEKKGEPVRAIEDYEQARKGDPTQGEPAFRAAHCYLAAGRPVEAESTISGALKLNYDSYTARDQMLTHAVHGEVQMAVGDYPQAERAFGEAIKVAQTSRPLSAEPSATMVFYNMSRTQFEQGAYKKARDNYQNYIEGLALAGGAPDEQDLYTQTVISFLCGDIAGARKLSQGLGPEFKARADAILAGDTFSVKALYEMRQKQQKESSPDGNR